MDEVGDSEAFGHQNWSLQVKVKVEQCREFPFDTTYGVCVLGIGNFAAGMLPLRI